MLRCEINAFMNYAPFSQLQCIYSIYAFISQRSMSNGFIYVVNAHVINKIEENKYPEPKCL